MPPENGTEEVKELMPKGKSRGKLKPNTPPAPAARVKRRHSPGGKIICHKLHLVSRRRYNMALRFGMLPSCKECGSTDLQVQGGEVRSGGGASRGRLIFNKHKGRLRGAK